MSDPLPLELFDVCKTSLREGGPSVLGPPAAAARGTVTVCFPFVGDAVGGSHISAAKLIKGLAGTPFAPRVVLHHTNGQLGEWLRREKIAFEAAPPVPLVSARELLAAAAVATAFSASGLGRLARFIKRNNVKIVHTNDSRIHVAWGLAAKAAGAKLLWHHRGDPTARGVNMLAPFVADAVVAVSSFARPARPLRRLGGRLSVVHSPFDHPVSIDRVAARRALAEELDTAPKARFLGFLGHFIERKRPLAFVDAIHALLLRHPSLPVHGAICGTNAPGEPDLESAVRERILSHGLSHRVHMMGFRTPVAPVMGALDALVIPAVSEPFGRTLIEAMLLGVPVIATRHGGNAEAIENRRTGLLVPPDDVAAMVHAIDAVLRDEALAARLSRAAQADARRRFGVRRHVKEITRIYTALLRA